MVKIVASNLECKEMPDMKINVEPKFAWLLNSIPIAFDLARMFIFCVLGYDMSSAKNFNESIVKGEGEKIIERFSYLWDQLIRGC